MLTVGRKNSESIYELTGIQDALEPIKLKLSKKEYLDLEVALSEIEITDDDAINVIDSSSCSSDLKKEITQDQLYIMDISEVLKLIDYDVVDALFEHSSILPETFAKQIIDNYHWSDVERLIEALIKNK